jgi:hypothetical protein
MSVVLTLIPPVEPNAGANRALRPDRPRISLVLAALLIAGALVHLAGEARMGLARDPRKDPHAQ